MATIWIPFVLSCLVSLWALWPRYDGGGIHYNYMLASLIGPGGIDFAWYILGAMVAPWLVWGALVWWL